MVSMMTMVAIAVVPIISVIPVSMVTIVSIAMVTIVSVVALALLILFFLVSDSGAGKQHAAANSGGVGAAGERCVLNAADQTEGCEFIGWDKPKALRGGKGAARNRVAFDEHGTE